MQGEITYVEISVFWSDATNSEVIKSFTLPPKPSLQVDDLGIKANKMPGYRKQAEEQAQKNLNALLENYRKEVEKILSTLTEEDFFPSAKDLKTKLNVGKNNCSDVFGVVKRAIDSSNRKQQFVVVLSDAKHDCKNLDQYPPMTKKPENLEIVFVVSPERNRNNGQAIKSIADNTEKLKTSFPWVKTIPFYAANNLVHILFDTEKPSHQAAK